MFVRNFLMLIVLKYTKLKTITTIKKEIKELLALDRNREPLIVLKKAKKRIQFLNVCLNYLESQPKNEFLEKEKKRLENRLNLIDKGFEHWAITASVKDPKKEYAKLMDVKTVKEHLKTIRFLIN